MKERICERDDVLSLEWKVEGLTDGENEGDDCDDVWYTQDVVNQEKSEHNEIDGMKKGADSTCEVMHM